MEAAKDGAALRRSAGRSVAESSMEEPRRAMRPPKTANGAGIAADPTLTDAWSFPKERTWHPMFRHPSTASRRVQGLSPALAPASGSTLRRGPPGEPGRSLLYRSVPTLNGRFRGRVPQAGPSNGCASSGPKTFRNAPSGADRAIRPVNETPTHFLQCFPCLRPKPSAGVAPDVRGQVPPRHPGLKSLVLSGR